MPPKRKSKATDDQRTFRAEDTKSVKEAQKYAREMRKDLEAMKASGTATTAELKAQTSELRKANTELSEAQKFRTQWTKDSKKTKTVIDETEKLQREIADKIADMSKDSKEYLKTEIGVEDITARIADNHARAVNYSEKQTPKAKATSDVYKQIGDSMANTLGDMVRTEEQATKVGTAEFGALEEVLVGRKQEAEAIRATFMEKLAAGELDQRSHDRILKQLDALDAMVKVDEDRLKLLEEIDSTAKAAASSITAPLEKVSSFVKSMPFGPLISNTMKLDEKMSATSSNDTKT